jgi:glucoamylase
LACAHGDKSGRGRAWPLLTGERGHYELAAGHIDKAQHMLTTMAGLASQIGFLSEQVWDADDLPRQSLFLGRPSGSAMPLAWTHSEYIRLLRSIRANQVFDRPVDAWERYAKGKVATHLALWRFDHQPDSFPAGRHLRIELLAPAVVHFSLDGWRTTQDMKTHDTGLGFHVIDLPTAKMSAGDRLIFTFQWPQAGNQWEKKDFEIVVDGPPRGGEARQTATAQPKQAPEHAMAGH